MNYDPHQLGTLTTTDINTRQGLLAKIHLDLPLLSAIFLAISLGLIILYSASGNNFLMVEKQLIRIVDS